MPKKTKKQKMRADDRHMSQPLVSAYTLPASIVAVRRVETQDELAAIRTDMVKTLVLAVLAIGIEFALYYRWR